ncbi:MAG: hypothetical protein KatS3mg053_0159 [Candidatus Roseilinea sp.]|nr:MAG: hypothetical protein KatS3mg053_0159 [Candidatus Roseilinea sp.]
MTKKRTSTRKKTSSAKPQATVQNTLKAEDEPQVQNTLTAEAFSVRNASALGVAGQQNLDLGSILGGLMGGTSPASSQPSGMGMGSPLGGLIGPIVDDVARKLGIPRELAMLGAMFLMSKLLGGALGGQPSQQAPQMPGGQAPGEIDLGSILGGLLGGMEGMPPAPGQAGTGAPPSGAGEVLGKIGQAMSDSEQPQSGQRGGILIQGLTAGHAGQFLTDNNLTGEFAQFAGVDQETAERSLAALLEALSGGRKA